MNILQAARSLAVLDEMWREHGLFPVTMRHFTWATKSITRKLALLVLSPRQVTQHKWNSPDWRCSVYSTYFTYIHHLQRALQLFYALSSSYSKTVRLLTFVRRWENVWIKHRHVYARKVNRRTLWISLLFIAFFLTRAIFSNCLFIFQLIALNCYFLWTTH